MNFAHPLLLPAFKMLSRSFLFAGCVYVFPIGGIAHAKENPKNQRSLALSEAFDATIFQGTKKSGENEIIASWSFTNRWDFPLIVERFEESCGCLRGVANQSSVAPGDKGRIEAKFNLSGYRGLLRKSLHVRFAGFEKPIELVAEVEIPGSVEVSPRELKWLRGDKASKMIEVTAGTELNFEITDLIGVSDKHFTIVKEVAEPGRHYRVKITPNAEAVPGIECLQIRTNSQDTRDRVVAVFLNVE